MKELLRSPPSLPPHFFEDQRRENSSRRILVEYENFWKGSIFKHGKKENYEKGKSIKLELKDSFKNVYLSFRDSDNFFIEEKYVNQQKKDLKSKYPFEYEVLEAKILKENGVVIEPKKLNDDKVTFFVLPNTRKIIFKDRPAFTLSMNCLPSHYDTKHFWIQIVLLQVPSDPPQILIDQCMLIPKRPQKRKILQDMSRVMNLFFDLNIPLMLFSSPNDFDLFEHVRQPFENIFFIWNRFRPFKGKSLHPDLMYPVQWMDKVYIVKGRQYIQWVNFWVGKMQIMEFKWKLVAVSRIDNDRIGISFNFNIIADPDRNQIPPRINYEYQEICLFKYDSEEQIWNWEGTYDPVSVTNLVEHAKERLPREYPFLLKSVQECFESFSFFQVDYQL